MSRQFVKPARGTAKKNLRGGFVVPRQSPACYWPVAHWLHHYRTNCPLAAPWLPVQPPSRPAAAEWTYCKRHRRPPSIGRPSTSAALRMFTSSNPMVVLP